MLCFDIQVEIVKRLPVKPLIRFRSVCKSWKSLIDSSHFITGYNSDQPQHLMIKDAVRDWKEVKNYVCVVDDDSFPQQKFALTVPPLVQTKTTTTIDSSHGLLCLNGYLRETNKTDIAVIWNPAIRKSIAVAVPEVHPRSDYIIGFGVCPDTKDPMLVKITDIYYTRCNMESISFIPYQVMVFTLSSREWTYLCSSNLPRESIEFKYGQTVIGRFIYWLAYDLSDVECSCNLIMSFDMSTQEFREINLPDYFVHYCGSDLYISRLRDSLALLEYDDDHITRNQVFVIWMMEDGDSKSFTKLYTIKNSYASPIQTALGFRKSGKPIVVHYYSQTLVVYEPFVNEFCSSYVTSYTESLLLLNEEDGTVYFTRLFEDEDDGPVAKC